MIKKLLFTSTLLIFLFFGCKDEFETSTSPDNASTIALSVSNLSKIDDQLVYQGWLIFNDDLKGSKKILDFQPKSDGKFDTTVTVQLYDLKRVKYFLISLESINEDSAAKASPNGVRLLGAKFIGNDGTLAINTQDVSLNFTEFSQNLSGKFTLFSPTHKKVDSLIGVWFVNNNSGNLENGLTLPALEPGWEYEGWVLSGKYTLSTGTFTDAGKADNSAAYSAKDNTAPQFPGEDFINMPTSQIDFSENEMKNAVIIITVNRLVETSFVPFVLRFPVMYGITQGLNVNQSRGLEKIMPAASPAGTLKITANL